MRRLYHILLLILTGVLVIVLVITTLSSSSLHFFENSFGTESESGSGAEPDLVEPINKPIKILILGDMMFDRGVRSQINSKGFDYVFGPASAIFSEYDKVIANLEGPITSFESKTILPGNKAIPGFQFTFPIDTSDALKKVGIDIVSLANNHTYNFGAGGLTQTRNRLAGSGVQFFGSPENNIDIATSTCITVRTENGNTSHNTDGDTDRNPRTTNNVLNAKQICIGFIGWHEFGTKNHQKILDEIALMRPKVQYLIVFPHWGEEYMKKPHIEQVRLARVWTDAGADTVIGAHPHVIQQITRRTTSDGRVVPIFYSLGNFIFDQYFSFDTTHGIGVEIEFPFSSASVASSSTSSSSTVAESAIYRIIPFESTGSHVSIPNASSTAQMIKDIETVSGKDIWSWLKK